MFADVGREMDHSFNASEVAKVMTRWLILNICPQQGPNMKLHRVQKTLVHATSPRVVIFGAGFGGLSAAKPLVGAF